MSGEIQYSGTLTNSGLRISLATGTKSIDQTTKRATGQVQAIGTTHEALILGELSTCGWAYFENKDLTNYVEIGADSAGTFIPFMKLLAGEYAIVRLGGTNAPYARANTAAVELRYEIMAP